MLPVLFSQQLAGHKLKDQIVATALVAPPEQGQLVSIRSRKWIVNDVAPSTLPTEWPGWVYVKIADFTSEPDRMEFFPRRTIDDWFDDHPKFVIDKAEAITNHGEMLGIHVRFHEADEPQKKTPQKAEAPMDTISIEVHGQIAQKFSKEYIEAVVDDALKILPSYRDRQDTLVVINPRRVAVLLDKQAHRGAVLPLDLVVQVIDEAMKVKLEKWLSDPPAPFYVMHIAGSWFGNSEATRLRRQSQHGRLKVTLRKEAAEK